ncbi:hypothetical protein WJU16_02965 [Chitinophaga pollutisoli]|uniref:Restriction endonuclease n=1 Tax=Chitinophaga pollutisoli TaxID=3133966 RepID=A0ABZ2YSS8_9BACT
MNVTEKDGKIYVELSDGTITMTYEEAMERLKRTEEAMNFTNKWLALFGGQQISVGEYVEGDTDAYTKMELFYDEACKWVESEINTSDDPLKFVTTFNTIVTQVINGLQRKLIMPAVKYTDQIKHQIKVFEDLRHFMFEIHHILLGAKKMAEFRTYIDFRALIDKFGNREELMQQYQHQSRLAPNKRVMIEKRISTLVNAHEKFSCSHHFWIHTGQHQLTLEFGQYSRIGYSWIINGNSITWKDLDIVTLNNVTLNAAMPFDRRTEAYVSIIHQLIRGGALAYHISFLEEELDRLKNASADNPRSISSTVHKIHFYDLQGRGFERLTFAYLVRTVNYPKVLKWYGESGGEGGRDIWAEADGESWCFQCKNYPNLPFSKIKKDIDRLVKEGEIPDHYVVVAGGTVSKTAQDKIRAYCKDNNIANTQIWTGAEFEESLRSKAPDLLKRFFNGEEFPEISD